MLTAFVWQADNIAFSFPLSYLLLVPAAFLAAYGLALVAAAALEYFRESDPRNR